MGRAVSQSDEHVAMSMSIVHWSNGSELDIILLDWGFKGCCFVWQILHLMNWRDGIENSFDWRIIKDIKGALICLDAENWGSVIWVGMGMFRPPRRHGKDNRSFSSIQQGSQPVRAKIKCWWITSSKGWNKKPTDSLVHIT